jgi:hypothetical protein
MWVLACLSITAGSLLFLSSNVTQSPSNSFYQCFLHSLASSAPNNIQISEDAAVLWGMM